MLTLYVAFHDGDHESGFGRTAREAKDAFRRHWLDTEQLLEDPRAECPKPVVVELRSSDPDAIRRLFAHHAWVYLGADDDALADAEVSHG